MNILQVFKDFVAFCIIGSRQFVAGVDLQDGWKEDASPEVLRSMEDTPNIHEEEVLTG